MAGSSRQDLLVDSSSNKWAPRGCGLRLWGAPEYLLIVFRVIHRQDYHTILLEEAQRLGAVIRLNADVAKLDFERTQAILSGGEVISGDVIVGADGRLGLQDVQVLRRD
jgi:hypothetical protein